MIILVPLSKLIHLLLCRLSLEMVNQDSCISVVEDMDEKLTLEILSISSLQTIVNIVLSGGRYLIMNILSFELIVHLLQDSYVYLGSTKTES